MSQPEQVAGAPHVQTDTATLQSTVASPTDWLEQVLGIVSDFKGADLASPAFWSLILTQVVGLAVSVLAVFSVSVPGGNPWVQLGETLGGIVAASIASVVLHRHLTARRSAHYALAASVLDMHPATRATPPILK